MFGLDLMPVLAWVIGALGTTGIILALLFFCLPTIATLVLEQTERALQAIAATRLGCAMLAFGVAFIVGAIWAERMDAARFETRMATTIEALRVKAAKDAAKRDASISNQLVNTYEPVLAQLKREAATLQQQVSNYEKSIPHDAGNVCRLGADALRLRKPAAR